MQKCDNKGTSKALHLGVGLSFEDMCRSLQYGAAAVKAFQHCDRGYFLDFNAATLLLEELYDRSPQQPNHHV